MGNNDRGANADEQIGFNDAVEFEEPYQIMRKIPFHLYNEAKKPLEKEHITLCLEENKKQFEESYEIALKIEKKCSPKKMHTVEELQDGFKRCGASILEGLK